MATLKAKATKVTAVRILDENAAPKNAKDSRTNTGSSRIGAGDPPRKLVVGTSRAMAAARSCLNVRKGKAHGAETTTGGHDNSVKIMTRRKALADVSNSNSNLGHLGRNQLNDNPKIMKDNLTRISIAQGKSNIGNKPYKPRISLTKSVVVANVSTKAIRVCGGQATKPHPLIYGKEKFLQENVKSSVKEIDKLNVPVYSSMRRKTSSELYCSRPSHYNSKLMCHGLEANQSHDNSKVIKYHGVKLLRPRLSFTTQKAAVNGNPSSKNPAKTKVNQTQKNSKQRSTTHVKVKQKPELEKCNAKPCGNKEAEPSSSSCDDNQPTGSQGCDAERVQFDGSYSSSETMKLVISRSRLNRRKSYTLSLVARSEIMGESAKLVKVDELPTIDDQTNPLEVVEYVDDIYQYYWTMEVGNPLPTNYMTIQSDITPRMRGILINWLIEVHHKFKLMQETLFLMVEVLDRVLSVLPVRKDDLQMVGLTALLLASKYEDYWHPKIDDLISVSANLYTRNQILDMEKIILKKLRFRLNVPTPYVFMLRFLKAAQSDKKLEHLAFYLIELCLVEYEALKYRPSLLCASAIYVARCTLQLTPPWTGLLSKYARYKESNLRACAEMILGFQRAVCLNSTKYTYEKFLNAEQSCVATIKALDVLPP